MKVSFIRKATSILLAFAIILTMLPLVVFAEEPIDYSTVYDYTVSGAGTVTINGFSDAFLDANYGNEVELIIPETISGYPVVSIANSAFYDLSSSSALYHANITVTKIDLSDATYLTYIGSQSFHMNCSSSGLGELVLPDGLITIGANAFHSQDFSGDLTLPDSIESIGNSAFAYTGFDGNLTLPDNENYTAIMLQTFMYSDFTSFSGFPSAITYIGANAFSYTNISGHIEIPEGVTTVGGNLFAGNYVTSITLPSTVEYVATNVFANLNGVTFIKVNFSFEDVTIVTTVESMAEDTGDFWNSGTNNSSLTVILSDEASYDAIYSSTSYSRKTYLSYQLTLSFDGLDESYDRTVLYNRPINWVQTDPDDVFSWTEDTTYMLPEVQNMETWSFSSLTFLVGETIVTPTTAVTGDTLYCVGMENVTDYYTYYEFGSYPQSMFAYSSSDLTSQSYLNAIALVEAAEEEGRSFYRYETNTVIYWFEYEPIVWRYIGSGVSGDETYYVLWSEYVLDQHVLGESVVYSKLSASPLYAWLNGDFTDDAFADYEQEDFLSYTTGTGTFDDPYKFVALYSYTFYDEDGKTVLESDTDAEGTAITPPTDPTKDETENYTYAFDGWYDAQTGGNKITDFGTLSEDVTYYARYTAAYKGTVSSTLSSGDYAISQEFELSFDVEDSTIYFTIDTDNNEGEVQEYDPTATYYISMDCTLTAWAEKDDVKSTETSYDYTITGLITPDLSGIIDLNEIIIGNTEATIDTFDIILVPGITSDEESELKEGIPEDYETVESFHLYATVNGKVIEDAMFNGYIGITLTNLLDDSTTYQLIHLKQDGTLEIFKESDGTLIVDAATNSITFEFDVSELSPFMLVAESEEDLNADTDADSDLTDTGVDTNIAIVFAVMLTSLAVLVIPKKKAK